LVRIPVKTESRSYDVLVERGLLLHSSHALNGIVSPQSRLFVVTSAPIARHWSKAALKGLGRLLNERDILEMPDGERAKRLDRIEKLADKLVAREADRKSIIVALGGGVVGDVAGFLASVFMRGVPVVQVPTTLVAQLDSAIGGKTGVNLDSGKNLVGTFHQPSCVLVDPDVLSTLPEREYRSGLFEAMKYGVIRNSQIFETMEQQRKPFLARDGKLLERLISACIQVKADVVSADERESGERVILNFGHTIGHALEAETGYSELLHGEAVGWGMVAAARIGEMSNVTDKKTSQRICRLVENYGPLRGFKVKPKRILKRLISDKKTIGGRPHFVLAKSIGEVTVANNVPERVIFNAVEELNELAARR
jgi:3-dehydroquinate synthase